MVPSIPHKSESLCEAHAAAGRLDEGDPSDAGRPRDARPERRTAEHPADAGCGDLRARAMALLTRERMLFQENGHPLASRLEALRVSGHDRENDEEARTAAFALGILNREQGSWAAAFEVFESVRGKVRSPVDDAACLCEQAIVRLEIGPPARVVQLCARALRFSRKQTDPALDARIRLVAAEAYIHAGDHLRARHCLDRLRVASLPAEEHELHCLIRRTESDRLRLVGRLDAAVIACEEASALASRRPGDTAEGRALLASIGRRWAQLEFEKGALAGARQRIVEAQRLLSNSHRVEAGRLSLLDALIDLEGGDDEAARVSLRAAEQAFRATRRYLDLARLLLLKGEVSALREASLDSRAMSREGVFEARGLFRRLGRDAEVRRCDLLLDTLRSDRWSSVDDSSLGVIRPPRVPRVRRLSQLGFITADPSILRALEPIESLARTPIPVLVLGESGTGKEVLARALHRAGGGRGPFLPVNCGALPTELQESELFGHVRGAFTGAIADKIGLFEAADGGTLLLDEVGEMSPRAQVKLLRVLELGEVRRVGETRTRRVQVRVIAATNADLNALIRNNGFRRDLYYRLCGLKLELPPLRCRLGDIPLLAAHFVNHFGSHGAPAPVLSPEALDRLLQHSWPGNIRELRFCVEKACALSLALGRSRIESDCISIDPGIGDPPPTRPAPPPEEQVSNGSLDAFMENMERRLILKALEENGWNRTRAAHALGRMSRTTLIGKMKRLGLFPTRDQKNDGEPPGEPIQETSTPPPEAAGNAEG